MIGCLAAARRTALAFLTLCLAGCATTSPAPTERLIGRWESTNGVQTAQYAFRPDGTFRGFVAAGDAVVSQFTGKWAIRDNAIVYEYTADRFGVIAPGTKDRDRILSVAQDHFVIETADGTKRKYVRVATGG